jgi:hypothetical protein
MNFDRMNGVTASAFALLRRDKSAVDTMAMAGESATVGRANTQRAERKIGRVRLRRTVNRSIWGSTESHPTVSKLRGRGGHGADISHYTWQASVRSLRGQSLLQDKLEKKGTSPKIWYWTIFRSGKFESAASQNDPVEIGRNWSRKFLQFLENFSGVYPPGGEGSAPRWLVRSDWVRVGQTDSRVAGDARIPKRQPPSRSVAVSHAQSRQTRAERKVQPRRQFPRTPNAFGGTVFGVRGSRHSPDVLSPGISRQLQVITGKLS